MSLCAPNLSHFPVICILRVLFTTFCCQSTSVLIIYFYSKFNSVSHSYNNYTFLKLIRLEGSLFKKNLLENAAEHVSS